MDWAPAPSPAEQPGVPASFEQLLELLTAAGERPLVAYLEQGAHLIAYEPGRILLRMTPTSPPDIPSTAAWWIFVMRAIRPPSSPWIR